MAEILHAKINFQVLTVNRYIWTFMTNLETLPERFTEVVSNLIYSDTTHSPDCQGSDQWIWILTVLKKKQTRSRYNLW